MTRFGALVVAAAALAAGGLAATSHESTAAAPVCVARSASQGLGVDQLVMRIAVWSDTNAWGVGSDDASRGSAFLVRWDGHRWQRPAVDFPDVVLKDVAAGSPTNVWAVGKNGSTRQAAVIHWDGRSWQAQPPPSRTIATNEYDELSLVTAPAPNDVWVAGHTYRRESPVAPLLLHWDGHRWAHATAPLPKASVLSAIAANDRRNVWLVGSVREPTGGHRALALRWDGRSWHTVRLPTPRYRFTGLDNVIVGGPDKTWIFGSTSADVDLSKSASYTFAWNGHAWSRFDTHGRWLARGPSGGFWGVTGKGIERLEGTTWRQIARLPIAGPDSGDQANQLVATSAKSLWFVGWHVRDSGLHVTTVIRHYVCR